MNVLIRDVPEPILSALDTDAASRRQSRQERLIDLLDRHYGEKPIIMAWLKANRNGELALNDEDEALCAECGQPLDHVWIGVLSDGSLHMPVCSGCAMSE